MTPPAAAPSRTRTRRHAPPPRRISGPARPRSATAAAPPPLALRLGGAVHGLAEHHLLDRIARGRAWIAILGVGLIGIVFMQVSMLRTNAGIGRAVERTATLERHNSALRAAISQLSSGERIAAEAAALGLVAPAVTPRFLDGRSADARRALASITPPGEGIVPSAAAVTAPSTTAVVAPVLEETGITPQATTAPVRTDPAAAPVATEPAAEPTATPPAPAPATGATETPAEPAAPPTSASTGGVDASGQAG